jgi:hypothetical protein
LAAIVAAEQLQRRGTDHAHRRSPLATSSRSGTTTITYTATDASGNTTTGTQ